MLVCVSQPVIIIYFIQLLCLLIDEVKVLNLMKKSVYSDKSNNPLLLKKRVDQCIISIITPPLIKHKPGA